ncbi:MAG: hypothetical protein ACLQUY_23710 [Ktedonobacterales bacterium]
MLTLFRKRQRIPRLLQAAHRWRGALPVALCLALGLAGCGLTIHPGGSEIAFLRNGTVWVIQPDGTNARSLTSGNIASLAWSPDHHQLLYRLLLGGAAFPSPTESSPVPDATASIMVIGIDGGVPLPLTANNGTTDRSDAWWNTGGNRLIYRQDFGASPNAVSYVVSQSDQPAGIASKPLLYAASLPVLSGNGQQVAVLDSAEDLRIGGPGSPGTVLAHAALLTLPVTGRPAHLLWQPSHNALLYPAAGSAGGVRLVLVGLDGKVRWSLMVPSLLDAAFSPNGSLLLVQTPSEFEVFAVGSSKKLFSWNESDAYALPWWAPDSNRLLVLDQSGLTLVDVHRHLAEPLGAASETGAPSSQIVRNWWEPATSDPWSADGSQIVFSGGRGETWEGRALPAPKSSNRGLYVGSITGDTPGSPHLIDSGDDILPTWSYPDPSTTFLIGA